MLQSLALAALTLTGMVRIWHVVALALMGALQHKYKDVASDIQGNWADNVLNFSLKVMGFTVSGKVTVQDKLAKVEGQLPLAAAMFRGRIEESIKSELQKELTS
jgi:hypothetical protein